MSKQKYDNTKDYPFLAFCNELSQRCSKLNALDVQIYSVMLDDAGFYEYHFGHYTPAHEDIAIDCGTSRSSVIRCINNKLIPLGLVSVGDSKIGSATTYRVHDYRTITGLLDKPSVSERKEQRRKEALAKREEYRESISTPPEAPQEPEQVQDEPTQPEVVKVAQNQSESVTEDNPANVTDDDLRAYIENEKLPACDSMVNMLRQSLTKSKTESDKIYKFLRNRK